VGLVVGGLGGGLGRACVARLVVLLVSPHIFNLVLLLVLHIESKPEA
jgi:hypothetical protein